MGIRGPLSNRHQALVMGLLNRGEIIPPEAALIAGVTPQCVGQWCKAAGLDWRARRRQYLKTLWNAELQRARMIAKGVKPKRRTKRQVREVLDAKVLDFLERGGKIKKARQS